MHLFMQQIVTHHLLRATHNALTKWGASQPAMLRGCTALASKVTKNYSTVTATAILWGLIGGGGSQERLPGGKDMLEET